MKKCTLGEHRPSLFVLQALALDELHGDHCAEIADHVSHCPDCTRRLRALQITQRCNQAIAAIDSLPDVAPVKTPLWHHVADRVFTLRERINVALVKGRELVVCWADGLSIVTSPTVLDLLSDPETTILEKKVHIDKGEGDLTCSLCIFRDPKGVVRMGVEFGTIDTQHIGLSRVRLLRGGELKESRTLGVAPSIVFNTLLEPGDYVFELRANKNTHRIEISVNP